jgi:ferredoxin-NADP reductase
VVALSDGLGGFVADVVEGRRAPKVGPRVLDAMGWLTTPLLPDDYLGLVNPLWSAREQCGRVETVRPETADAASLVIRPGRGWAGHRAGQYVRIGVDVDGVRHTRTYSLSSPPEREDGRITITVKVVPGGVVSTYLVRRAVPGVIIRLGPVEGTFVLPEPLPARLLFLTAGSGITPVMGILRSLASGDRMPDTVVVHSAPTRSGVIFGAELRAMAARFAGLRLYERHTRADSGGVGGRLTAAGLSDICPDWSRRHTWACGPTQLLDDIERHWRLGGMASRLQVERFRPAAVSHGGRGGRVRFTVAGRAVRVAAGTPLLVAGEDAGVLMPSGCRMGICYSCVARLASGRVRDLRTGQEHGDEGELIQTCVSAAAGDVEIEL